MRIWAQHVRAWEATSVTRARTWRPGRSRGEEARPREARVAGKGTRCWGGAAAGAEGASEEALRLPEQRGGEGRGGAARALGAGRRGAETEGELPSRRISSAGGGK
jgi:hypothetical protein